MRRANKREPTSQAERQSVRRYSRVVRLMKVMLPMGALALIAVIFLSARQKGDLTDLFTAQELATLGAGLKLENPRFAGVTDKGEAFALKAAWALPDSAVPRIIDLERPEGEIEMSDGREIAASADSGRMFRNEERLVLQGGVVLDSSDGYHIETDRLEFDIGTKTATAPGPVTGTGPRGRIESGSFRATAGEAGAEGTKIWFENRVRLVFIPASDDK